MKKLIWVLAVMFVVSFTGSVARSEEGKTMDPTPVPKAMKPAKKEKTKKSMKAMDKSKDMDKEKMIEKKEIKSSKKTYTCPMCHIDAAKPGNCPMCGMDMVEKTKEEGAKKD